MERNGVGRSRIEFLDPALDLIIDGYTREAGVRNLEREIGSICRKVAREFAEGTRKSKRTIRPAQVEELLGKRRFQPDTARRTNEPGVATGLAWTGGRGRPVRRVHGLPRRGQPADHGPARGRHEGIGRRGASPTSRPGRARWTAACPTTGSQPRRACARTGGAVPKDGPSAGITMAAAIASRITRRQNTFAPTRR